MSAEPKSAEPTLIIRNGTIVDGTGAEPVEADLALAGDRIVGIGDFGAQSAVEEIDARGKLVTPGFVDIHTHYDAQLVWDQTLSISPWHGVTTAVVGNCGFGIAPMRPAHREMAMRTLEKVEGMSYDSLHAGLGAEGPFESYTSYLDLIEWRGVSINVGAFIGHTPLRLFVMGEEATEREATQAEIEAMQAIVREAMNVGALGFSTSKAPTHHGYMGKPVPSRLASFGEIDTLGDALEGGGVVGEYDPDVGAWSLLSHSSLPFAVKLMVDDVVGWRWASCRRWSSRLATIR